jgi:hypothetical protein
MSSSVAGLAQVGLGQILGVAAQHDIGAASGHVGGDGDGAELAGLRDDLGFLLVVLGVEHVVLYALALFQHEDSSSLFSMDMVPTSTGWPFSWHSMICSMTARYLPFGLVDHVVVVDADHGLVGGYLDDIQLVDGPRTPPPR